jgi:putative transposon-encoded protein
MGLGSAGYLMAWENKSKGDQEQNGSTRRSEVKFEVYGEEMMEKVVTLSGNSGRIYLPPDWVGHKVKIIKVD